MWSPDDDDNPGVLEFQGRKYAVGLLWLIVTEDEKKTLRRRRIKKAEADFFCLRTHISRQIGFGWLAKGHRRHMPVGAIIVADQLVGEWHGVFQADNGWWYMQVHADAIAPNGDQFFTAESDAYAAFHENLTKHTWAHSYAPLHWNVAEASREMTLARLLDDVSSVTLQSTGFDSAIGGAQNRNILIAMIFGLIMLIAVVYAFSSMWSQPDDVATPKTTPIPTLEPPKKDVIEIPSPDQVIRQCNQQIQLMFKPILGWQFKSVSCTADALTIMWEYNDKNVSMAQNAIKMVPAADNVTMQGKSLIAKKALIRPVPILQENMLKLEEASLKLQQLFTKMGKLEIKSMIPPPAPPPAGPGMVGGSKKRPPPPRPYLDVTLKTVESPDRIKNYLDIKGLQLVSIIWDVPKGVWTYKMSVKLALPREKTRQ
jgi:hypothetical protein